ncbi:MAG: threonine synthase [Gemmatimonadetes bacterium]|nr:threonine synthase [Gemmatimonadota bacterium]MBK6778972.1 threonine synthase [Gemmatimonadota bacterium]MBK7348717.1 threonine synthase [Gemmatimonadota bacterium]MBK7714281.1 threonine synthase [Gemmatimonadota bacterium]MBK7783345.1 threonine synthase [Gemmatimonadota bacterium]
MTMDWHLECSGCGATCAPDGFPSVCPGCGQPWLVRYPDRPPPSVTARAEVRRGQGMWRYRPFLPLLSGEQPVTLGEGDTPLLEAGRIGRRLGLADLWIKDEGANPTGSFKARGLSAAITRAVRAGARQFVIPTAGNAGVAAAAYASRAGVSARVYAPRTTPRPILDQIRVFGGELVLLEGHIGDCGRAARTWAAESGAVDLSTLREPYRIEGKKTLGLELAMQFNWTLPAAIIYPTGGGTGLIGMWKAFAELREAGWVTDPPPRMFSVQSTGCAPVVRAFEAGADRATPWEEPWTIASGLRVPGPLGDRLMLRALRESQGGAIAVTDDDLAAEARRGSREEGIDLSPEGGAALAAARRLREEGVLGAEARVVVFNTGAGWLYRGSPDLP